MQYNEEKLNEDLLNPREIIVVANKYILEKRIGKGSFGEVFKGYNRETR